MEGFIWTQEQIFAYVLILARVSAIFAFAPIFGSRSVMVQLKAALSLVVSVMLFMVLQPEGQSMQGMVDFAMRIAIEVIIGAAIGYVATFAFEAIQFAGELMGLQMGFGIVNVIDPLTSVQVSLIGQFKFILAVLLFLLVGGHRMIVESIGHSFLVLPPGQMAFNTGISRYFVNLFSELLVVGVRLAAPVVTSLLMTSLAEGLIARTVPQMNIFIVGFGVRIAFGLFILSVSVAYFAMVITGQFEDLPYDFEQLFRLMM
jgi:flagellar biosynthetic protein FliR